MAPIGPDKSVLYFTWGAFLFWGVVAVFEFGVRDRAPKVLRVLFWIPGKFLRLALIVMTLGVLAACSSSDPLAVASGSVYQLNAGHWQPGQTDLSTPPRVTNN